MKIITGLSLLAACATLSLAQENYLQWSSQKSVTVNTQSSGTRVAGDVKKFPLLVRLTSANADVFAGSVGKGRDIRFAKTNSAHLKYQIERWDSAAKAAEIWVLMDTVYGNSTTTFNMYWGKSGVSDSSNGPAVFDTANGFVGVWHLGDAPKAQPRPSAVIGAPTALLRNYDSTTYVPTAGIVGLSDSLGGGPGDNLAGNTANYIDLNHRGYNGFSDFSTGFTFSTWIYESALVNFERFVEILDDSTSSASSDTRIILFGNKNPPANGVSVRWGTNGIFNGANDNTYAQNAWYHLVFSKPGGSAVMNCYSNGRLIETTGALPDLAVGLRNFVYMGRSSVTASDAYYQGKFDEPEISKVARDSNWVKLAYQTQRADSNSTFVTFGSSSIPAPASLSYAPNPAVYTVSYAIPANSPTVSGTVTHYSVSPALPAGLSLDSLTGILSGTPTLAASAANYTVTASNSSGNTTASLNITVNASLVAPTSVVYKSPILYGVNSAIANNIPVVTGTAMTYSVAPALPTGLSLNASTGVISGTPTAVSAAANYVVTAGNTAGSLSVNVNIAIVSAPSALSYSAPTGNYPLARPITANNPTVTGTISSYSVSPALPAGLTLNTSTGVISGTPGAIAAAANYTVTATNPAGSTSAVINITVYGPPSGLFYVTNPASFTGGQAATPDLAVLASGTGVKFSVAPALPAGLVIDSLTGTISGTPTVGASGAYVVTATNGAGTTTVTFNLTVSTSIAGAMANSYMIHFSSASNVTFQIPDGTVQADLSIVNIWGRTIWSRTVQPKSAHAGNVTWEGTTNDGQHAASGLYIVRAKITAANNGSKLVEEKMNYTP